MLLSLEPINIWAMREKEIFEALQERLVNNVKQLTPSQILFQARFEVDHHISKKNGKTPYIIYPKAGGKPYATLPTDPIVKQAEEFQMLQLRSAFNRSGLSKCIGYDVRLWGIFHFYFSNYYVKNNKRVNRKINDLSNLYELPQDALQKAGVIEDDGQIESHDLSRRLPGEKNEIEIILIKYENIIK